MDKKTKFFIVNFFYNFINILLMFQHHLRVTPKLASEGGENINDSGGRQGGFSAVW